MSNNLTDRSFWKEYWKNYQYKRVGSKTIFDNYFPKGILSMQGKSSIEIGGFTGMMSIYFKKKYGLNPSLVDFYIDMDIIRQLEQVNGVDMNTINCIESDFFQLNTDERFDFVFSVGFIEHFDNTEDVIKRHVDLLAPNGSLFIVLPNFLGLNGWLQSQFDKDNFEAHNLHSMNIQFLREIMNHTNLKNVKVKYTRKPMVWLEPKPQTSKLLKLFVKCISYTIKLFPIKSKLLSPYIVISANK